MVTDGESRKMLAGRLDAYLETLTEDPWMERITARDTGRTELTVDYMPAALPMAA